MQRVSYVTKSAAVFLVLMILSPVTAPFASFPLSVLMTPKADTHAALTASHSDATTWAAGSGTVLVEEQMKDGDVLVGSPLPTPARLDERDSASIAYASTAVESP